MNDKFIIYNNKIPIVEFKMTIYLRNIYVLQESINIMDTHAFWDIILEPLVGKNTNINFQDYSNHEIANIIELWLKLRCIPNDYPDFDKYIHDRLQLCNQYSYDRLFGCQYLVGAIDYFSSKSDNVYCSPEKTIKICHILTDYRFWGLYIISPKY